MESELLVLTEAAWPLFKEIRLRALADAPDAFGVLVAEAEANPDDVWRTRAARPDPTLLVLDHARPVAMGGVFVPPGQPDAMIWGMWTAPEARGRGHAGRIVDTLVAWCRERGLGVLLDVTEGNDAARRLYEARGFAPTGHREPLRDGSPLWTEQLRLR